MKKQTAVDWFVDKVFGKNGLIIYDELIQQAKAMEKEQILNACQHFADYPFDEDDVKQYYNETYSNGKKD
jgi:hypothetical protein